MSHNGSLAGADVTNDSLRGRDIVESSLGPMHNAGKGDGLDANTLTRVRTRAPRTASTSRVLNPVAVAVVVVGNAGGAIGSSFVAPRQ
jgi:hypothetical protein